VSDVSGADLNMRQHEVLRTASSVLNLLGHEDLADQVFKIAKANKPDEVKKSRLNDRKRAWQWLHLEIRRRALYPDRAATEAWIQGGHIWREVVDPFEFALQLAGFGATFATMFSTPERAIAVADKIGAGVMLEPDKRPDGDEDFEDEPPAPGEFLG
jgi:hypothetical protein